MLCQHSSEHSVSPCMPGQPDLHSSRGCSKLCPACSLAAVLSSVQGPQRNTQPSHFPASCMMPHHRLHFALPAFSPHGLQGAHLWLVPSIEPWQRY